MRREERREKKLDRRALALHQRLINHAGDATQRITLKTPAGTRTSNAKSVRRRDMPIGIADRRKPHRGADAPRPHQQNLVEEAKEEASPRGEPLEAKVVKPNPNHQARVPVELERDPRV